MVDVVISSVLVTAPVTPATKQMVIVSAVEMDCMVTHVIFSVDIVKIHHAIRILVNV